MAEKSPSAVLRPKRQITIPKKLCDELGLEQGDRLQLSIENGKLIAKPKRATALEALREIQRIFKDSGISEEEIQEEERRIRREISEERRGVRK